MSWISSLAGKAGIFAASLIIGLAFRVPFVMKIVSSEPNLFPFTANLAINHSKTTTKTKEVVTATQDQKPIPVPPLGAIPVYPFMKPDIPFGIDTGPTFSSENYNYSFEVNDPGDSDYKGYWIIQTTKPVKGEISTRKVIGSIEFNSNIESGSFSPDSKYLAFETRNRISSSSVEFQLYTVDLSNGSSTELTNYPKKTTDYDAIPYIESYTWNPDDTLNVVFYYIFPRGNNNYYRISDPTLWNYNFLTGDYAPLGKTTSTEIPSKSLFSDSGILGSTTLKTGVNNVAGLNITLMPVYEIAPDKVFGLEGNAADNYSQVQETIWNGYTIVQNEDVGGFSSFESGVYDNLGNLIFQKGGFTFGMFLQHVLTFAYQGNNYFILGGGDCGNAGCGWEYNVFRITSFGSIQSLNKNDRSLWTNGGDIDSTSSEGHTIAFVVAHNGNLYLFIDNDSGGYHVIELNPEGSIVKEMDTNGSNLSAIFSN